jgi:phospholipid transport system substrate-binding protein
MTYSKALKFLFTLSFVLTLTVSGAARASEPATPQGAAEFVEMLGQVAVWTSEINDRSKKKAALRNLIDVGFNLDFISQFVLGKIWNRTRAVQRAEFKDLFAEYVVDSYESHFNRISALTVVTSDRVAGGDFLVQTSIDRASDTAKVVWRVRAWDSEYRVIDTLIDGASLALIHRSEFVPVVQQEGFEKLMQTLRKGTPTNADFGRQL